MASRVWFVKRRGPGWAVQRKDATVADSVHDAREPAIARGIDIARRAHGQLLVKDSAGRIEEEHDYSAEPAPGR